MKGSFYDSQDNQSIVVIFHKCNRHQDKSNKKYKQCSSEIDFKAFLEKASLSVFGLKT